MMYLVTNRLPASLTIEDIGVRLDAAGGSSSSKLLPEQTFHSSRQIKEYERKKWVTIEVRPPVAKPPIAVWPFSAAPTPASVAAPVPVSPPSPESLILQGIMAKLDGMLAAMQKAPTPATIYQTAASLPAATSQHQAAPQPSVEPIFIPSQIIPKSADVSINVKTSESESEDFDSGLEALKKARRK